MDTCAFARVRVWVGGCLQQSKVFLCWLPIGYQVIPGSQLGTKSSLEGTKHLGVVTSPSSSTPRGKLLHQGSSRIQVCARIHRPTTSLQPAPLTSKRLLFQGRWLSLAEMWNTHWLVLLCSRKMHLLIASDPFLFV